MPLFDAPSAEDQRLMDEMQAADHDAPEVEEIEAEAPVEEPADAEGDDAEGDEDATEEDDEPEEKPVKGKKLVPLEALHATRQKARQKEAEYQSKIDELTGTVSNMRAMMQRAFDRLNPAPAEQETPKAAKPTRPEFPSFDADPLLSVNSKVDFLLQQLEQQQQSEEKRARENNEANDLRTQLLNHEEIARAKLLNYDAVIKCYVDGRVAEYTDLGYSPTEANQRVRGEIVSDSRKLLSQGLNPAEQFYRAAAKRYASPATPTPPVASGKGVSTKVAAAAAAARSATTLSKAPARTKGDLTPEDFARGASKMSDAAFMKAFQELYDQ